MNLADLPSDSLFFAGLMATLMPVFTSVYGTGFVVAGIGIMAVAVYSLLEFPMHNIVVLVGGVAGLSVGIYSALQFGDLESGIPMLMGILLIATSVFTIEEESRRFI